MNSPSIAFHLHDCNPYQIYLTAGETMSQGHDRYTFVNEADAPAGVTDCIRAVIKNWDNMDDPDHLYLTGFSEDVDFLLPPTNSAKGHEQLKALRSGSVNSKTGPIIDVEHTFHNVYVKAGNSTKEEIDVMWTGNVLYTVFGGEVVPVDFATRFEMRKMSDRTYKTFRARIFADSTTLTKAIVASMSTANSGAA